MGKEKVSHNSWKLKYAHLSIKKINLTSKVLHVIYFLGLFRDFSGLWWSILRNVIIWKHYFGIIFEGGAAIKTKSKGNGVKWENQRDVTTPIRGRRAVQEVKWSTEEKLNQSRMERKVPIGFGSLNGLNDLCYSRASATVWQQTYGWCLKREQVLKVTVQVQTTLGAWLWRKEECRK